MSVGMGECTDGTTFLVIPDSVADPCLFLQACDSS